MKSIQIKSLAMVGVLGVSSLFLQSCSEEQVTATVAVIAVAAILADDTPVSRQPDRNENHRGDWDRERDQRGGRGDWDRERDQRGNRGGYDGRGGGRCEYGNCGPRGDVGPGPGPRRGHFLATGSLKIDHMRQFAVTQVLSERAKVEVMATKYHLSTEAAEKLQTALTKAQAKDYSGVDEIGIARSDMQALYDNKNVTRYTLVNIGSSLGISFDEAKVFVAAFQRDIEVAKTLVK